MQGLVIFAAKFNRIYTPRLPLRTVAMWLEKSEFFRNLLLKHSCHRSYADSITVVQMRPVKLVIIPFYVQFYLIEYPTPTFKLYVDSLETLNFGPNIKLNGLSPNCRLNMASNRNPAFVTFSVVYSTFSSVAIPKTCPTPCVISSISVDSTRWLVVFVNV